MREVTKERSGWRDQEISERHRKWGWNCPMVDLDFVCLEYDKGEASALVEFKHENAKPQFATQPSYLALVDLGNKASVPVFAVRYASDFSWWKVVPLNEIATRFLPERVTMTEEQWIALLYSVRGREVPAGLFDKKDVEL